MASTMTAQPGRGGPPRGDEQRPCPTCGTILPIAHRFCFHCGARIPDPDVTAPDSFAEPEETRVKARPTGGGKTQRSTMFFGAIQAARAKLTLIRGDGLDGVSFTLAGEDHYAGRYDCPLVFPDDPFLSPVHANFYYRESLLVVRDEGSTNGVYVRITGTTEIGIGTWFLVGEQVLEVQAPGDDIDEPIDDGTYFFASPRRPSNLRIVQVLRGGESGLAYRAPSDVVSIGREGNDINFPDDPFISGHHAKLSWSPSRVTLTDLGSRNGTFVRIAGEQVLRHGDYVFMGQQLLRVEIV
jgi:pSer/pThr/pTyr-binding forkhead associated (FHA) protein